MNKRMLACAGRNLKELLRDPMSLIFGLGFPIVIMSLMTILSNSIAEMPGLFSINSLAPGTTVFGQAFVSLFAGMLIASDRENSFLMRLFTMPLKASDFILGYSLPLLGVAMLQGVICLLYAGILGMDLNVNFFMTLVTLIPTALLYIGFGILFGTIFTYKQVGGVSSVLVNVAALLSGTWFDLSMVGGAFHTVCYILPFAHAVDMCRAALLGNYAAIPAHLWVVCAYAVVVFALSVLLFRSKMRVK